MNTVATKFASEAEHLENDVDIRARSKASLEETTRAVESLRQSSAKILAQGAAANGTVAAMTLEMVRAIWQAILNILRFLASLFGVKLNQAEMAAEAQANANPAVVEPSDKALETPVSSLVPNDAAAQVQAVLQAAQELPAADADAFMRAVEFSGVTNADRLLLDFARQSDSTSTVEGLDSFLVNYLKAITAALDGMEVHLTSAAHERAAAAQEFAGLHEPPILTERLIALQRHALSKGLLTPEDMVKTERLTQADDAMLAVAAHRQLIVDMAMLFVSEVAAKGVPLEPHDATLERIGGAEWITRVNAAGEALDGLPHVVETPVASTSTVSQRMKDAAMQSVDEIDAAIDANSDAASKAALVAQKVTNFFAGVPGSSTASPAPAAPAVSPASGLSLGERMRIAAEESAKFNPLPPDDQQDRFDDFENPKT